MRDAEDMQQEAGKASEVVLADLTERTLRTESVGTHVPRMQLGDGATFYNEIYDSAGEAIGSTVGIVIAVSRRSSDDHLITEYTEVVQLPAGTLHSTATVDRDAMLSGEVIHADVIGMSGEFLGMKGVRQCQLIPPISEARVSLRIELQR